jgi:predicted protein tyrosine phosphatase
MLSCGKILTIKTEVKMTKILFVCSANVDRSPTAEHIYKNHPGLEVKSAGASYYAKTTLSEELLLWADVVLCMEKWQITKIENFSVENKRIDCLDIEDEYGYMSPELIEIITEKVDTWLREYQKSKNTDKHGFSYI